MSSPPEVASDEGARDASRLDPAAPGEATASLFFRRLEREQVLPGPILNTGRVVGDFRLLALIGGGGMGQVWEAEQISLGGRRVAVKFVRPDRVTPHQLELFEREARAGGRLHHPGIVEIYAYGETEGLSWIAMELIDGAWTLRDSIDEVARSAEVPPDYDRAVARLIAEIADAMQAAHGAGVIHRDLKPQNVLITPDERSKVTDFGLARISDEPALSQTGDFAGTYFYMSPEQITAKRVRIDHRTDVFSLGVILYEMLALRRPFQGDTSHQIAEQILVSDPPDPRGFRSRIAPELVAITGKALEKERARRYASMGDFADDLRRYLSHWPILARPTPPWRRLAKWARRHPAKSGIAGVAALAFGVLSVILFQLSRTSRDLEETTRRFVRISTNRSVDNLAAEADRLWPPYPEQIEAYERWIEKAQSLVDELPQYRSEQEELQRRLLAGDDLQSEGLTGGEERVWMDRVSVDHVTRLIEALEALVDPGTGLLGDDAISPEHGWSVPKRLALARKAQELARRWDADLSAIREFYAEPELRPAPGLVPIGQDPNSGLFEFWHVASGEEPMRGPDGTIVLRPETGIVLVLVPGGRFLVGAQKEDPSRDCYAPGAEDNEQPVHPVFLSPYYIAKFETTREQWRLLRLGTSDPTDLTSDLPLLPVGSVSWIAVMNALSRFGLELPTEAQWEYACRAGTRTLYWSGEAADLARAGWYVQNCGGVVHAIAEKPANPWGLHDVHGNVWEWCRDWLGAYSSNEQRDPLGPSSGLQRVIRGGSFWDSPNECRSARRNGSHSGEQASILGFRVAFPANPNLAAED